MITDNDALEPVEVVPAETDESGGNKGWGTAIAWLVILLVTGLIVTMQMSRSRPRPEENGGQLAKTLFEFQVRYMLGAAWVLGDQGDSGIASYLDRFKPTADWQRVRIGILAGEMSGPEAAIDKLRAIKEPSESAGAEVGDGVPLDVLTRLYRDYSEDRLSAPSVSERERRRLRSRLGWFGKLALAPRGRQEPLRNQVISSARAAFYTVVGGVLLIGIAGLVGLFVLITFVALLLGGGMRGLKPSQGNGGIYAEAFACWLLLFLFLNLVGSTWFGSERVASASLLSLGGSILAVGWPWIRGIPWPRLREELGWTAGRGLLREGIAGVGCYAMAIPLVIMSVIVVSLMLNFAGGDMDPGKAPVHPAAEWLVDGSWWQRIQLLLLACVAAPILEETMFRGFFYRHLREATGAMSTWISVLLSALIASAFFAVLHPQGLLAAPGIIGIGLALAFMREWRQSLVPSMLAHAINNAIIMVFLMTVLST